MSKIYKFGFITIFTIPVMLILYSIPALIVGNEWFDQLRQNFIKEDFLALSAFLAVNVFCFMNDFLSTKKITFFGKTINFDSLKLRYGDPTLGLESESIIPLKKRLLVIYPASFAFILMIIVLTVRK